ncbi:MULTISPECIES: hypothetical protein [Exiguobacterium]|uniref:Uncharacterized protein n=1 Tax=Exiguobacterium antarcticum TaxID=132920 RepID=A0ABT6R3I5_9BACL|nr:MULTISPECIES: hypothetical protein [Exiguobacterium]AFS70075.1 Hypothetical protein Eab7_0933 [Exiguobacterium antarcticum B7]MCT4781356.1 hypothetical protein [Exiguobacterium soli]MDI3235368.1 hypothetical protein [Exiguobacterium antarcticum]
MYYDLMENKTFIPTFERFLKEGTKLTVWFPNDVTVGPADELIGEAEELFGVTAEVIDDPQSYGKTLLLPYLTERETRDDDFVRYETVMTEEVKAILRELTLPMMTDGDFAVLYSYQIDLPDGFLFVEDWFNAEVSLKN